MVRRLGIIARAARGVRRSSRQRYTPFGVHHAAAEWFYQDLDSDISQDDVAGTATLKSNGTATRLIVRFTF